MVANNSKRLKVVFQPNLGCVKISSKTIQDFCKIGDILEISLQNINATTTAAITTGNPSSTSTMKDGAGGGSSNMMIYGNSLSSSFNNNNNVQNSSSINSSTQMNNISGSNTNTNNLSNSCTSNTIEFSLSEEQSTPILFELSNESIDETIPANTIRIDSAAGNEPFNIKQYAFAIVKVVDKKSVTLDLVELLFKDQYFNGHDMWRIKMHLQEKCLFIKKYIEFCGMRCQARELWCGGEIVTCGFVSETTRVIMNSLLLLLMFYLTDCLILNSSCLDHKVLCAQSTYRCNCILI